MLHFDQEQVRALLPWPVLRDALREMFAAGASVPMRQHHEIQVPGEPAATLLLMPAWRSGRFLGVKIVSVFPGNAARGIPAVSGLYVLADATTGRFLAEIDGGELTARRTAAASVLAATYLARPDARTLLLIGTGRVCRNLAQAYCALLPIERVLVAGRSREKAARFAAEIGVAAIPAVPVEDIASALAEADIVSAATLSAEPVIEGRHLRPGAHVDLVGAYRPDMREADDEVIRRAGGVFVDTFAGALAEAGDIVQPIAAGLLSRETIAGELADLCAGRHLGRRSESEITVFKSVGTAIEDLAAASALYERAAGDPAGG